MSKQRRVLLGVTGLSPQVVTETLYALAQNHLKNKKGFLPTEIHLLTTELGARRVREALLDPENGHFFALLRDYPILGKPKFDKETIHVIKNENGEALEDIRTPDDNAAAADAITRLMANLTSTKNTQLHVSIAGGRKTMGFYLGYAFSLFARPDDVMSHVLVSSPFENHPEFFYPPAKPKQLSTISGELIDTRNAKVTLAIIPIVHLRQGQPKELLSGQLSFNDTVAALEKRFAPARLLINLKKRLVICGDKPIKLPPALLAWYAWWAEHTLQNSGPQNWRTADLSLYLDLYQRVVGQHSGLFERSEKRLAKGLEKGFFEQYNAKLSRLIKDQLGLGAAPYLLSSTGQRPFTSRCLTIAPEAITLIK